MIKVIISLFTIFIFSQIQAASFCESYSVPSAYATLQKNIDKKIDVFANKKTIATQADAVLSKLLAAKSPLITAWMNKRDFKTKSEDAVVKEWRTYFARNFILTKYPSGDAKIDLEIEQLVDDLLKENLNSKFVKKIEQLFERAKQDSVSQLQSFNLPQKDELVSRAKAIKLYWPKSLKSARNNAIPLDLIDWGIAYDPVPNEINIGLRAYAYPNDETYLAVFAHEIGHSFDSCRWGAFFTGPWPFEKVGACLRLSTSVGAQRRDDGLLEKMAKENKLGADLVASLKENPTCNKLAYPPIGLQADQLPESFADWFSAEVMADMKKIDGKKVRTDLCESKDLNSGSSYPSNTNRLYKIYFTQPKLKALHIASDEQAGVYCSLEKTE